MVTLSSASAARTGMSTAASRTATPTLRKLRENR